MYINLRGRTRIVVLVGAYAFKIARIRLLSVIGRLLLLPFQRRKKKALFVIRYGAFPIGIWNYIFMGFKANKNEYQYWLNTNDPRVVPVIGMFLSNFILIQKRGHCLDKDLLDKIHPFKGIPENLRNGVRLHEAHQYVFIQGRVLLADYGECDTIKALHAFPLKT